MKPNTLAEHREALCKIGMKYGLGTDDELRKVCDALGVEYEKPKSMAAEWSPKMFDQAGAEAWLTAFESAVRADERKDRETERGRILRHVSEMRHCPCDMSVGNVLDQLQKRIDEGK